MANQLAKDLEIMFENYVEGFEAACVVSRNAKKFRPGDTAMQRAGDVLYRDWETDRKSTRLNSRHSGESRMPSPA